MTGRETLKPCPFCGGEAELHPTFWGLQPQTSCQCGGKVWAHSEEEAIARWNTRPSHELVEALEEAGRLLRKGKTETRAADRQIYASRALTVIDAALSHARPTDGGEQ